MQSNLFIIDISQKCYCSLSSRLIKVGQCLNRIKSHLSLVRPLLIMGCGVLCQMATTVWVAIFRGGLIGKRWVVCGYLQW